jgi:hypothetical protein
MNHPADQLWLATRQLVTHTTRAAALVTATMRTALDGLTHTIATAARPAGMRGLALETGVLAAHLVLYPWGAVDLRAVHTVISALTQLHLRIPGKPTAQRGRADAGR